MERGYNEKPLDNGLQEPNNGLHSPVNGHHNNDGRKKPVEEDGMHDGSELYNVVSTASSADLPPGVAKVQAALAVWGPRSKWVLFTGLALACYVYSLEGMTTYLYRALATSTLQHHSMLAAVDVACSIIIAVGKPFWAKFADVLGRGEALIGISCFYIIGYAVTASSNTIGQLAGGSVLYTLGYTGLQIMTQIIVADVTTLRWRGLASSLLSIWFIMNAFVAAEIAEAVLPNWRWGYGMFCIIMPAALSLIIVSLLWSQWRAKKIMKQNNQLLEEPPMGQQVMTGLKDMDFVGLVLLGTSLALILLPFTLVKTAKGQWKNPSMIAMLVVGFVLFPVFLVYDFMVPRRPVFPMRWLRRPAILGASLIGFFDFVSFYLQYTYLYSYIMVTEPTWTPRYTTYFLYTQTIALTVFAIMAGAIMAATRRFKWMLVAGLLIRLLGVGIMLHARGPNGNIGSLVMCQVLQGMGGGFAAITTMVAAQASVSHADVATVTAVVLLITEVGNSVGGAAAGGLWTQHMPGFLEKHVGPTTTNSSLPAAMFGNIMEITALDITSPERQGAIAAYQELMHMLVIGAIVVAIFPPIFAVVFIKNIKLTDTQNAVDGKNLAGEKVDEGQEVEGVEIPGGRRLSRSVSRTV